MFFLPDITPLHARVTYVRLTYYGFTHWIISNIIEGQIWRRYEDYANRWIFGMR